MSAMARTTFTHCLPILGTEAKVASGPMDIVVDGSVIVEIRSSGEEPPEGKVVDARNRLAVPGFINGHYHSHESFHKGRYDNIPLELWMNYVRPSDPIPLTPRQVYLRTLIGAIEALRTGTTTLIDDLNVSPVLIPEQVEAVFQAYDDVGIRAFVGLSLFDRPFFRALPFVEEEFPSAVLRDLEASKSTPPEELLDFCRDLARHRHPSRNRVGYMVSPSAPQRCSSAFLAQTRELADTHDLPVNIHVHETRLQAVTAQLMYGQTMIAQLAEKGFLKPKTSLIHAVWLTPSDIDRLAASGATVQHNPISNLKLGSGLLPMRALLDAGVNVSLGSDGCASTETVSMLKAVSLTALVHKLRGDTYDDWIDARDAWLAATRGSAIAIGRGHDLGRIAPGYTADLAFYRLDSIPFTPTNDALRQLVYCETGANLDMVVVEGSCVMEHGRLIMVDEDALLVELAETHRELEPLIAASERRTDMILPAYRRIYERCRTESIAQDTLPAKLPD